ASALPVSLLLEMREHFAWTRDYRLARLLGHERSQRLRERLDELAPEPVTDPELLHGFRHLIWFSALVARGADLRAGLLAIAVGRPMQFALVGAEPATLRRLGIGPLPPLHSRLKGAAWLRRVLCVAGFVGAALALGADETRISGAVSAMGLWWLASILAAQTLALRGGWVYRTLLTGRVRARIERWRATTLLPPLAALTLVIAAAGFAIVQHWEGPPWLSLVSLSTAVLALGLAWPQAFSNAFLSFAMAAATMVFARADFADATVFSLGCAVLGWTFFAAWLIECGAHRPRSRWLQAWHAATANERQTAFALLLLPVLPYFVLRGARRYGSGIVLAALAAGVGFSILPLHGWVHGLVPIYAIAIAFVTLIASQESAVRAVDRLRSRGGTSVRD
ncbi:MAG: hypothetical protein M3Z16_09385, partial [Pseudomonadota bacterium]|nr:hypothetical protein [Pseudomonadota bacterium]